MELDIQRGRLSGAERLINEAMDDPRIDGSGLPVFLGLVYCQQGRLAEAERLIEAAWDRLDASGNGHSERAIVLCSCTSGSGWSRSLRKTIRAFLDRAARLAPEDDRVWLARANLAIRTGKLDDAKRWLDACLRDASRGPPGLALPADLGHGGQSDRGRSAWPPLTSRMGDRPRLWSLG